MLCLVPSCIARIVRSALGSIHREHPPRRPNPASMPLPFHQRASFTGYTLIILLSVRASPTSAFYPVNPRQKPINAWAKRRAVKSISLTCLTPIQSLVHGQTQYSYAPTDTPPLHSGPFHPPWHRKSPLSKLAGLGWVRRGGSLRPRHRLPLFSWYEQIDSCFALRSFSNPPL